MDGLVFSSYVNAFTIYRGARLLGIQVATTDRHAVFPIPSRAGKVQAEWLLFTEEASLRRALNGELTGKFLPEHFPIDMLDDKWAFVEWLKSIPNLSEGLRQWPLAAVDQISYPCLVKAKHSWVDSIKLPRGWVCRTPSEVATCVNALRDQGLEPDHFFIQEWWGDEACRVISVCGFHDWQNAARNLTAIVERVAAHSTGLSCSAAVETIEDEWQLQMRTEAILKTLEFTGPYELEYLVGADRVAVLELNPRFWMQHAIFLADGNGLMKRYFGKESAEDLVRRTIRPVVWVDGLHLVRSVICLRLGFPFFVLRKKLSSQAILIWPSVPMATYAWLRMVRSKVWSCLRVRK